MSDAETKRLEWMLLGNLISEFAKVGARPWELRLLALKGGRVSTKDIARLALKHQCDVKAARLVGWEER